MFHARHYFHDHPNDGYVLAETCSRLFFTDRFVLGLSVILLIILLTQ